MNGPLARHVASGRQEKRCRSRVGPSRWRAGDLVEQHYPKLIRARVLTWNGQMARESSGLDALRRIVDESVSAMELAL